jgi:hypothetical protein
MTDFVYRHLAKKLLLLPKRLRSSKTFAAHSAVSSWELTPTRKARILAYASGRYLLACISHVGWDKLAQVIGGPSQAAPRASSGLQIIGTLSGERRPTDAQAC